MASVFTHVAVPLLIGRVLPLPPQVSRTRLALAAAAVACVPDLDLLGFLFDVHATDLWGHRGMLHSLAFAALLALVTAALFFRGKGFATAFRLLFLAAASHGLIDALTRGDVGVALFAPFSAERFLSPLRPIPVVPLGGSAWFSRLGAVVLLNELLFIDVPLAILTEVIRRARAHTSFTPLTAATVVWMSMAGVIALRWPYLYAPTGTRLLRGFGPPGGDEDLGWIPRDPLPDHRLVTRFDELLALGLFGRRLEPASPPWSSGFFPAWYGGDAGRWRDSRFTLIARTLFGFTPLEPEAARAWLERDHGWGLAPSEKYDLAHADYRFAATRESLTRTHNARPRPQFWFGLCSGTAAAAIDVPEPFKAVDVQSPDGHVVRFHPIDVKALLAKAYYWQSNTGVLGGDCETVGFDSARECSMNPGGLAIGTLNYLGLARRSFELDVYPTRRAQNYAVASARLDLVGEPRRPAGEPVDPSFTARIDRLVDVDFSFELSSTTLSDDVGAQPLSPEGTQFARVGVHSVPFHWRSTLALDVQGEIIGGRWRGDPAEGPDNAAFVGGGPLLMDGGVALDAQPRLEWPFIEALGRASVTEGAEPVRLEVEGGGSVR